MADPRNYPVITATLVAPVVTWLAARYLPGLELTDEQATIIATGALGAGSLLATNLVRSRRSLPDVGFGVRSQKPVGSAGWVAALYIKMAPATSASSGSR